DGSLSFLDWSHPMIAPWAQTVDGLLTAVVTTTEIYPLVLIFFALRRRLDPARWFLAIAVTIDALLSELRITFEQGSRFTNWRFSEKLNDPLFTLNGNQFTPTVLAGTLLLAAIVYAVYQVVRETAQKQSDLEREFQSARELQQVLIPETLPRLAGYAVTSAYRPAQEVGGDFFQIIPLEGHFSGSALVLIGDVSGKGLKAAMTVSLIVGAARALAKTSYKPGEILAALNAQMHGRLNGGFATCLIMRLSASGRCTVASAGHMAPILNNREIEMDGSLPLGIMPDTEYQEVAVDLREGDHLALYTDGLLEARAHNGEIFGFERLKEMFSVKTDAAQATEMAVEFGQEDDITVLTVRRLASSEESSTKLHTHVMPAVAR
ncbi:MAG TPA: PP2C family protein-serine/threonine phosphatase, partial [Terracidiphilus sp.]